MTAGVAIVAVLIVIIFIFIGLRASPATDEPQDEGLLVSQRSWMDRHPALRCVNGGAGLEAC